MQFDEIRQLLPQKFPFLMVDRILSLEQGKRVVALKNITANEIYFLGHFPDFAVMPGALIIESMAQAAIVLFRKSYEREAAPAGGKRVFFFGGAKVRFLKPVFPGDQLQVEVSVLKAVSDGAIVEAVATVEAQRVAKAELSFGVKQLAETPEP